MSNVTRILLTNLIKRWLHAYYYIEKTAVESRSVSVWFLWNLICFLWSFCSKLNEVFVYRTRLQEVRHQRFLGFCGAVEQNMDKLLGVSQLSAAFQRRGGQSKYYCGMVCNSFTRAHRRTHVHSESFMQPGTLTGNTETKCFVKWFYIETLFNSSFEHQNIF